MYHAHHVLSADRTFGHLFAAGCAGGHVATLQHHAVDQGVHADFTDVPLRGRLQVCGSRVTLNHAQVSVCGAPKKP